MRYVFLVSVLPAVDDRQLSPFVEKQHIAPTGKQKLWDSSSGKHECLSRITWQSISVEIFFLHQKSLSKLRHLN